MLHLKCRTSGWGTTAPVTLRHGHNVHQNFQPPFTVSASTHLEVRHNSAQSLWAAPGRVWAGADAGEFAVRLRACQPLDVVGGLRIEGQDSLAQLACAGQHLVTLHPD